MDTALSRSHTLRDLLQLTHVDRERKEQNPDFPQLQHNPVTTAERSKRQIKDRQLDRHLFRLVGPNKFPFLISAVIPLRQFAVKCKRIIQNISFTFLVPYEEGNEEWKWAKRGSKNGENTHKTHHDHLETLYMRRHLHMQQICVIIWVTPCR